MGIIVMFNSVGPMTFFAHWSCGFRLSKHIEEYRGAGTRGKYLFSD